MKIFITGGSGLLGQYLNIEFSKKHEILTQYNQHEGNCKGFNSIQLSITNIDKLEEVFAMFKPDVVIHSAAVSNSEKADALASNLVYNINVNATKNIALLCKKYNAKLIYTSTDTVYAGYRGSMLKEDAKLIPVSLYAETKLMGEIKIQETFNNYLILRVPLLIGIGLNHTTNNFHKMFLNLKAGKQVKLFTDQYRTPLALHETARIILELLEKKIEGEIINLASDERVSRFELGEILCDFAGFNKNLLIPDKMDDAPSSIYKVADVSMSNEKLKSFGVNPVPLRLMIEEAIAFYHE